MLKALFQCITCNCCGCFNANDCNFLVAGFHSVLEPFIYCCRFGMLCICRLGFCSFSKNHKFKAAPGTGQIDAAKVTFCETCTSFNLKRLTYNPRGTAEQPALLFLYQSCRRVYKTQSLYPSGDLQINL